MGTTSWLLPLLVMASAASGGSGEVVQDTVDLIELNHFYDNLGRHAYDQVVFYEWSAEYSRYHVMGWCLIEDDPTRLPFRLPLSHDYFMRWYDGEAKCHREVRSHLYRESWTQFDPERENKKLLEEKYRIHLTKPPRD
ncbi:MAG: hypothetical protein ACTHK7_21005 [Aureliella sp.]